MNANADLERAVARVAALRRLPAATGRCYLTFDDGPDPDSTPAMLEALAEANVRATFFVIGRLARRHPELLRQVRAAGHVIGNHSYSHRHPWLLARAAARREIADGAAAIADVIGERPTWYRPPHGRLGVYVEEGALAEEQRVVLWSRSAADWGPIATPQRVLSRLRMLRAGDIVLLHDGQLRHNRPQHTAQALPDVLAALALHGPPPAAFPAAATMET